MLSPKKRKKRIAKQEISCYNMQVSGHRAPFQHWDVAKR